MKWHFGTSWRDSVAGLKILHIHQMSGKKLNMSGCVEKLVNKNKDEIPINRRSLNMT